MAERVLPETLKKGQKEKGENIETEISNKTATSKRSGKSTINPRENMNNRNNTNVSQSKSRSKSPQPSKPLTTQSQGLDENKKYSIFTSTTPSNTLVVTDKPISGKLINNTFRATGDLYEFSRSILKSSSLYEFDRVYNETHKLEMIYNENVKMNVNNLFHGKSACLILFDKF